MLLAIVALGYESCWVEGYVTNPGGKGRQITRLLRVPDEYELVCCLPVGVAKSRTVPPKKKDFYERAWFFEKSCDTVEIND